MLKIYIARHGQNVDNANGILNGHRDEPLTSKGIDQARQLATSIKQAGLRFEKIYTSPLSRAHKTADIIAETIKGPEPVVFDQLIERDFGILTGLEASRIEEICAPRIIKSPTVTYFLDPEGAETFPDLLKRSRSLLAKLHNSHLDGNILLVTHGDIGKMIYAVFYKLAWEKVLHGFHFGNSDLLILSEDSEPHDSHVFHIGELTH